MRKQSIARHHAAIGIEQTTYSLLTGCELGTIRIGT